eukprot:CAMPEP_0177674330 /NCGR_PEP_ID=MMETSP0447-20121125/26490_1 /TAXON_ID=0 /ORGANISM="Stygamoeba regulata, Strain BSH-02190019" /LENGTH=69 /DNA_ID=CAMNT_0019182403 /DNA_START=174 /DNA_END=380 /DNA_ORIENTATION=+
MELDLKGERVGGEMGGDCVGDCADDCEGDVGVEAADGPGWYEGVEDAPNGLATTENPHGGDDAGDGEGD